MSKYAHKGQILPITNQMIPIDKETTFHASYDYHLNGMNQGEFIAPNGPEKCFDFNGTDSKVSPGVIFKSTPSAVTVEFWFNARAISGYPTLIDFGIPGSSFYVEQYSATQLMVGGYVGTGGANFGGLSNEVRVTYALNTWTHVAYTATSSDLRVYINGIFVSNIAASYNLSMLSNSATVGHGRNNYNGMIADMRIWDVAKTESQIKDRMNKPIFGEEPGLVACWKLNETEGLVAYDASGNGRDASITGTIGRTSTGLTVATLKKEEGKFRGAVLVEQDTTNLLYDGGVFNSSFNTLTLTPTVTTIIPNHKYNIKTSSTGSTIRFLVPLAKLTNALGYTMSFKYKMIKGTSFYMADWCDTSVVRTEVDYADYKFQSAYGTRATYDATFRFMDFNVSPDAEIEVWDIQLEQRENATSFVNGNRPIGKLWYPKEVINPTSFTISCWFKIPYMHRASANNTGIVGSWYHPIIEIATSVSSSQSFALLAGPEPASWNRRLLLQTPVGVTANFAIQDDTWYHMVATFDGTTYKVYINGIEQISGGGPPITLVDGQYLMVGGGYQGKPNIMIDELRIESRAISLEEVEAWAASGLHYNYLDYNQDVD